MATAHIAHDCYIGDNAIIVEWSSIAGHVTVGKYAVIGGLAAIHQFIHIERSRNDSDGSLARKDVPPFTKAARAFYRYKFCWFKKTRFTTEKLEI
jgi:UDP-N-acetylglucosamine acyltransferase